VAGGDRCPVGRSERIAAVLLLVVMLPGAGCRQTAEPERVYVDLERVWAERTTRPEEIASAIERFQPPPGPPAPTDLRTEAALESVSSSPAALAELEARRVLALQKARELRFAAEQELREDVIRRVARDEARRRAELVAEAGDKLLTLYDRLQAQITNIAVEFAQRKSALLLRRAVLEAHRGPAPDYPERALMLADVKARLAGLDDEQRTRIQKLQAQAGAEADRLLGNVEDLVAEHVQIQLERYLGQIEERLADERFDLRLILPDEPLTPEISTLREALLLPPLQEPPEIPATGYRGAGEWERAARDSLRKEVALWAQAKGWVLAEKPEGARDVTDQFLQELHQ
jgi:hypothetical protein